MQRSSSAKDKGNLLLKSGDFEGACAAYTEGLRTLQSGELATVPLLANRALAFLRLVRYADTLSDCERVLILEPEHEKAAFRRGKALMGLRRYVEAKHTWDELLQRDPDSSNEIRAELARTETALGQCARGEFDFRAMLVEGVMPETLQLQYSVPLCNFISEVLELVGLPGHGRGFQAKRLVHAGELLYVSRPSVFVTYKELPAGNHQVLVDKTLEAAKADSSTAANLRELCECSEDTGTADGVLEESAARKILHGNSLACATGVGLWHAASFFNHADEANATRAFIADWMIVRSRRDIVAGEKVTLSYMDPTAEYDSQVSWLKSRNIVDEALYERACRWRSTDQGPLGMVKAALESGGEVDQSDSWPGHAPIEGSPLAERSRYLTMLEAEQSKVWYWGQMVRWLRIEQQGSKERGEFQRSLGIALAIAELVERHMGECSTSLEAWADCAALLFDFPQNDEEPTEEQGETMELCVDGVQRGIEFIFGGDWVEDADFSTLVLQWATSRWWHAGAWQRHALETVLPVTEDEGRTASLGAEVPEAIEGMD